VALRSVDEAWPRRAACRGRDAASFYPPAASETRTERDARELRAKTICAGCPVQVPCLEFALDSREPHGIWGGLTEAERQALLERRAG
jgi:WhiB family redox-sensing transcriptional regulator